MSWWLLYIIFAIATACSTVLDVYLPARHLLIKSGNKQDLLVEHPITSALTVFFVALILAPIFIWCVVVPSINRETVRGFAGQSPRD
jgi:hypothetical protein